MIKPHQLRLQWIKPLLFITLCLTVLALLVFGSASPAAGASQKLTMAQWTISFDFTNGQTDATLIVQMGYEDRHGNFIEMQTHKQDIACDKFGSLNHSGDWMEFDGSSYLKCALPDISDVVSKQTNGELFLPPTCTCKNGWVSGDVAIDPISTYAETGRTIYYHPDMRLSVGIPLNGMAQYYWQVDTALTWSDTFSTNAKPVPMLASITQDNKNYDAKFVHDGASLKSFGSGLTNTTLSVSTAATTIYLGYQPGGHGFVGRISTLKIDPPCFGGGI